MSESLPVPPKAAGKRPRQRRRWIVPLLALLLIPAWGVFGLPREISRWFAAAAMERELDGDFPGALAMLDRAMRWAPESPLLFQLRSKWQLEAKSLQNSLADADRAVQLAPQAAGGYVQRSLVYQHLGRHQDAVADWNRVAELAGKADHVAVASLEGSFYINVYNARGYAWAVGVHQAGESGGPVNQEDLQAGLQDVQRAIERDGRNPMYLDTRGFLYHLQGNQPLARDDLEAAVKAVEMSYAFRQRQLQPPGQRDAGNDAPGLLEVDLRQLKADLRDVANQVAVIRYHRALVYEALGQQQKAAEDRQRVRELGFEPGPDLF